MNKIQFIELYLVSFLGRSIQLMVMTWSSHFLVEVMWRSCQGHVKVISDPIRLLFSLLVNQYSSCRFWCQRSINGTSPMLNLDVCRLECFRFCSDRLVFPFVGLR